MCLKKSAPAGKVSSLSVIYRQAGAHGRLTADLARGLPMRQWTCGFGGNFARPQAGVQAGVGGRTGKHGRAYR